MSKESYLMMIVFVGCLAAVVYKQHEGIDVKSLWGRLLQRLVAIHGEIPCPEGSEDDYCVKSNFEEVSKDEPSTNAQDINSKHSDESKVFFEPDATATFTKEQPNTRQNGNIVSEEKKTSNNHENNTKWGQMKKLGEHGSEIIEGEIEELSFVPNGKDFYEHFLRKRRPLIMREAIKNWPAVKHWANESYLQAKYGDVIFDIQLTKKYEGEFPAKRTMNLTEFLRIYKSKQVYLDCPFPHSDMIQDIFVPYCLQCEEIMESIASTHLLFSSGNTSSSCHMDGYENLLSVIAGKKEVLVADPKFVEYFYPRNHTTVNIESPIDPEAVDLKKFPKLAEIPFHKVSRRRVKLRFFNNHKYFSNLKKIKLLVFLKVQKRRNNSGNTYITRVECNLICAAVTVTLRLSLLS